MQLVAIDLDGTLLSSQLTISTENLEAIREAQNQGNIVMICSGRAPENIFELLNDYNLSCPFAASNGTVVVIDGKEREIISMAKPEVLKTAQILESYQSPYKLYTNDGIWIPKSWYDNIQTSLKENEELKSQLTELEYRQLTEQPKETDSIHFFNHIQDVIDLHDLFVQKFFILQLHPQKREEMMEELKKLKGLTITTSGNDNIEVMDEKGNKGFGLNAVARHFNIPMNNTIAIGDNFNDVPMLEAAGLSVAMGNADPKVKEICDVVTKTNDEHGVAHIIRKYVLNK
jgi:hypothetical protein